MKAKVFTRRFYQVQIDGKPVEFAEESSWNGLVKLVNAAGEVIIAAHQNGELQRLAKTIFSFEAEDEELFVLICSPSLAKLVKQ